MKKIVTIMRPTVHLNGTSRGELEKQNLEALRALDAAIAALQRANPNARDYYVQGAGAFQTAQGEHHRRLDRLESVKREFTLIIEGLWDDGARAAGVSPLGTDDGDAVGDMMGRNK